MKRRGTRLFALLVIPPLVVVAGFALYTLTLYEGRCPGAGYACSALEYVFASVLSPAAVAAHTLVLGAWLVMVVLVLVLSALVRCGSRGCRR